MVLAIRPKYALTFHQHILFLKRLLSISEPKTWAPVESGIVERCRVLWNKVFLLFVYGPLFQTSQENGDQKSRSSDVLRYQRYKQYTKKWSSLTLTKIWRRMIEELQLVQLVSFYPTSRPPGFIFWKIFHNTRCPIIPETTLVATCINQGLERQLKYHEGNRLERILAFCGKGTGHWKGSFFKELRNGYHFPTIFRIICFVAENAWQKDRNFRKRIMNIQNMAQIFIIYVELSPIIRSKFQKKKKKK